MRFITMQKNAMVVPVVVIESESDYSDCEIVETPPPKRGKCQTRRACTEHIDPSGSIVHVNPDSAFCNVQGGSKAYL